MKTSLYHGHIPNRHYKAGGPDVIVVSVCVPLLLQEVSTETEDTYRKICKFLLIIYNPI